MCSCCTAILAWQHTQILSFRCVIVLYVQLLRCRPGSAARARVILQMCHCVVCAASVLHSLLGSTRKVHPSDVSFCHMGSFCTALLAQQHTQVLSFRCVIVSYIQQLRCHHCLAAHANLIFQMCRFVVCAVAVVYSWLGSTCKCHLSDVSLCRTFSCCAAILAP